MLDIKENVLLKEYTTMKVGGPAKKFVVVHSKEELNEALKLERPFFLGNGSNVLFLDEGYDGTVLKLGDEFSQIKIEGENITAGAGVLLPVLSNAAYEAGLSGLEFACGIPGSLGGAVYMNAGAYDHTISELLDNQEGFSYRQSPYMKSKKIITEVTLHLHKDSKEAIKERMNEYTRRRKEKQPLSYPSCGSFFKRPTGYFAGKLVEDAGLKGFSLGGAAVSDLHAGFIINKGNATAADILALTKHVQHAVFDKFNVMLYPEVQIIYNED